MDMKHTLLILSVLWGFTLGQGKPKVSLFPGFPSHRLYVSDEVTLRCKDGGNVLASGVTWFFKGNPIPTSNATLKFPAVTVDDSGTYQCEHGGQKSEAVEIKVQDMLPQASLSVLNNTDTVIGKGGSVTLKLYMEEGLNDWWCRYTEGDQEMWQPIKRDPTQSNSSLIIHADVGEGDGRTYWCMDAKKGLTREERPRSNAIKLTATGKMVRLQMSERPAWLGDDVTVSCTVWQAAHLDKAVFYKDGRKITGIQKVSENTIIIQNITKSSEGVYHCDATYRFIHISEDAVMHSNLPSDQQVLTVIGLKAALVFRAVQTSQLSYGF
ncbi:contactin-2-like isoform X2 [Salminus brasiliensis]|uniref:contactin-2-like isoform X2 n=1 Tax=Salminus brasiliensis TaxID=930266 RepID=UPI003B82D0D9